MIPPPSPLIAPFTFASPTEIRITRIMPSPLFYDPALPGLEPQTDDGMAEGTLSLSLLTTSLHLTSEDSFICDTLTTSLLIRQINPAEPPLFCCSA